MTFNDVEREFEKQKNVVNEMSETYRLMAEQIKKENLKLASLKNQLEQARPVRFKISDHAVLRYLERACSVDIDAHRKEIMDLVTKQGTWGALNAGFRLQGNVVTTYVPRVKND